MNEQSSNLIAKMSTNRPRNFARAQERTTARSRFMQTTGKVTKQESVRSQDRKDTEQES